MVIVLSRFVLVSKYVPLGPRFAILVGLKCLLFLRDPVNSNYQKITPGFSIKFAHLGSCPLLLLGFVSLFSFCGPSHHWRGNWLMALKRNLFRASHVLQGNYRIS